MKIGYVRVSTPDQNIDLQVDALEGAGCEKIFRDQGVSGSKLSRVGLDEALAALKEGDVLTVWKLDRLGRSLQDLIQLVNDLAGRGVGFASLSEAIDTTTVNGKLFFHIFGALAEYERGLNRERTIAGLEAAKKRGKHVGRTNALTPDQVAHAGRMIKSKEQSVSGMANILNVNRKTLRRALKTLGGK